MKKILSVVLFASCFCMFAACTADDGLPSRRTIVIEPEDPPLAPTNTNLNQLVSPDAGMFETVQE